MKTTLAALALASLAGSTLAETINARFTGVTPSQQVTVRLDGNSMNTRAGLFNFTRTVGNPGSLPGFAPTFSGFCIDLTEFVQVNSTYSWNTYALANAPTTGPMGANDAARLGRLFANQYNGLAVASDANQAYAAFQLAVWEIVHDSGMNLDSGDFRVTNAPSGTKALAQSFLNSVGSSGAGWNLFAIDNPVGDDCETGHQGYVLIPAPGAAAMLGLSALVAGRRKR